MIVLVHPALLRFICLHPYLRHPPRRHSKVIDRRLAIQGDRHWEGDLCGSEVVRISFTNTNRADRLASVRHARPLSVCLSLSVSSIFIVTFTFSISFIFQSSIRVIPVSAINSIGILNDEFPFGRSPPRCRTCTYLIALALNCLSILYSLFATTPLA